MKKGRRELKGSEGKQKWRGGGKLEGRTPVESGRLES